MLAPISPLVIVGLGFLKLNSTKSSPRKTEWQSRFEHHLCDQDFVLKCHAAVRIQNLFSSAAVADIEDCGKCSTVNGSLHFFYAI